MSAQNQGYSSIPQPGQGGYYQQGNQPPGYSEGVQPQYAGFNNETQPLHQPDRNPIYGQQQPGNSGYGPAPPQFQGYQSTQPQPPPFNPHYAPIAPAPAPHVQQHSTTNVVVVTQPQAVQTVVHMAPPRPRTYITLTAILMVVCFIHGNWLAFLFLVPALICAYMATEHNRAGEHEQARRCGLFALGCNIATFVMYAALIAGLIIFVAIFVSTADIYDNN